MSVKQKPKGMSTCWRDAVQLGLSVSMLPRLVREKPEQQVCASCCCASCEMVFC